MRDIASDADALSLYGVALSSRLIVGTAQYPSPAILAEAIKAARAEIVTVSLRRESAQAAPAKSSGR